MKIFRSLFFLCTLLPLLLSASEIVKNGTFSGNLSSWQRSGIKTVYDPKQNAVGENSGSAKLSITSPGWNSFYQKIKLEKGEDYELTFYIRGENILKKSEKKPGGAYIGITNNKRSLYYGSAGLFKYDTGSFDWKKCTFRFKFKPSYFQGKAPLSLVVRMVNATGTVWIDGISIRKAGSTGQSAFTAKLYPFEFLGKTPFAVAQNLPGSVVLTMSLHKKYKGGKAYMILELPGFIRLVGASEGLSGRAHKLTEKLIQRNQQKYRRYRVDFYPEFISESRYGWHYHTFFFVPEPDSSGKTGTFYWSMNLAGDPQAERQGEIEVIPAITLPKAPCRHFKVMIPKPAALRSPYPALKAKMREYWTSLAENPFVQAYPRDRFDSVFTKIVLYGAPDFWGPGTNKERREWLDKAPDNITQTGKAKFKSHWYKVEDPEGLFEKYVRANIRGQKKMFPDLKYVAWDFEQAAEGLDKKGRERFAKAMKLKTVPSREIILAKYRGQWFQYMVKLHDKLIEKIVSIIHDETPGIKFYLCSDPLSPTHKGPAAWCAVDVKAADRYVDGHMHMPYFAGTLFYKSMEYNLRELSKPYLPLIDPAERAWSFFKQYTPEKVRQNILAAASLGAEGIGFWPDDSFDARYFREIARAYGEIAKVEDFYQKGKCADSKFKVTPLNVFTKQVQGRDGKPATITYPDFSKTLKFNTRVLGKKFVLTAFNYDEKNPVFVNVSGLGKEFLLKLPPNSAEIVRSDSLPNQDALKSELAVIKQDIKRGAFFTDCKKGDFEAKWGVNSKRTPVIQLSNGKISLEAEALGEGVVCGLFNRGQVNFFEKGFAGRLIFLDTRQPAIHFVFDEVRFLPEGPMLTSTARIQAYPGANPEQNPLFGMIVKRSYLLDNEAVKVRFSFQNPSKDNMTFGIRINNLPNPGIRFSDKGFTATYMANGKQLSMPPSHCIFLKRNTSTSFLPATPRKLWDGGKISLSARDGMLHDSMDIIPDGHFNGIYSWFRGSGEHVRTIELLGQFTLKPGEQKTCEYSIRTSQ